MRDINTVALSGRLTRDAELKHTSNGVAICNFGIASNYGVKKGDQWTEDASFFDCVMFGKRADALAQYLTKGKQLLLHCEARQDRWEKDGQKRSKVKFVVNDLVFGSGGKDDSKPTRSGGFDDFEDDIPI
jgi:single-strand DNA-binding protein